MDWMGFDELPDKLTKADIQNWIDENRIEVEEVQKGGLEWKGDDLIFGGEVVASLLHNEDGTWSYQSDFSEVAFWKDTKRILVGLAEAFTKNCIVILETTANGFNEYKNMWNVS